MTGFEKNENVIGRPAFVEEGPDGAIYVTDDYTGSVYRVAYDAERTKQAVASQTPAGTLPDLTFPRYVRHSVEPTWLTAPLPPTPRHPLRAFQRRLLNISRG